MKTLYIYDDATNLVASFTGFENQESAYLFFALYYIDSGYSYEIV